MGWQIGRVDKHLALGRRRSHFEYRASNKLNEEEPEFHSVKFCVNILSYFSVDWMINMFFKVSFIN
jgi:hypothetical protein